MSIFPRSGRRSFFSAGFIAELGLLPGGKGLAAAMAGRATQETSQVYTRLALWHILNGRLGHHWCGGRDLCRNGGFQPRLNPGAL